MPVAANQADYWKWRSSAEVTPALLEGVSDLMLGLEVPATELRCMQYLG